MYRSKVRDFEVQVRTWACGHYKPCICAVIVKEGNDIVQLDMCERRRNQIAAPEIKSLSSHPLGETTIDTDRSGKSFYVSAFIFLFIVTPCHLDGIMFSVIATSDGNGWVDTRLSYP